MHLPPNGEEYPLAREPSRDFVPGELGGLLLDAILEPGDLLYIPRGVANYGVAEKSSPFSHHLTVSSYQTTAWCQLLDKALSTAIGRAAAQSPEFRVGLPVGFVRFMGNWHDTGDEESGRTAFIKQFQMLTKRLSDYVDLDEACDEMGIDFMTQRAPPVVATGKVDKVKIDLDSRIRFKNVDSVRPMLGTDPDSSEPTIMLFHCNGNNREEHMNRPVGEEEDTGCLHFEATTFLAAVRQLVSNGRTFVRCGDLPLKEDSDKIALCENLDEAGLLEAVAT